MKIRQYAEQSYNHTIYNIYLYQLFIINIPFHFLRSLMINQSQKRQFYATGATKGNTNDLMIIKGQGETRQQVIYTLCLLIFMIPCDFNLVSFFVKSSNKTFKDYIKGRRLNLTLGSQILRVSSRLYSLIFCGFLMYRTICCFLYFCRNSVFTKVTHLCAIILKQINRLFLQPQLNL